MIQTARGGTRRRQAAFTRSRAPRESRSRRTGTRAAGCSGRPVATSARGAARSRPGSTDALRRRVRVGRAAATRRSSAPSTSRGTTRGRSCRGRAGRSRSACPGPRARGRARNREVIEEHPDRQLVGDEGDRAHALAATSAQERIDLVHLGDQASPARRAALAGRRLLRRQGLGSVGGATAPDAARVLAVEERAVLPRVGDVVAETGEPLERVHRLGAGSATGTLYCIQRSSLRFVPAM
jgi:hypothetical protein